MMNDDSDINETGSSLDALREHGIDVTPLEAGYRSKDAIIKYGQQLRAMRTAARMTQSGLAKAADMAQADISRLEGGLGKVGPSLDTMSRLADACKHEFSVALVSQHQKLATNIINGNATIANPSVREFRRALSNSRIREALEVLGALSDSEAVVALNLISNPSIKDAFINSTKDSTVLKKA